MTDEGADIRLRLSAQRALLGAITANLRSYSVELAPGSIRTLAIYADEPSEDERDLIQIATAEIIADSTDKGAEEQILVRPDAKLRPLTFKVYRRHEPEDVQ